MKDETLIVLAVLGVAAFYFYSKSQSATVVKPVSQTGAILGNLGADAGNLLSDLNNVTGDFGSDN
jgi:hypothetical protein